MHLFTAHEAKVLTEDCYLMRIIEKIKVRALSGDSVLFIDGFVNSDIIEALKELGYDAEYSEKNFWGLDETATVIRW